MPDVSDRELLKFCDVLHCYLTTVHILSRRLPKAHPIYILDVPLWSQFFELTVCFVHFY